MKRTLVINIKINFRTLYLPHIIESALHSLYELCNRPVDKRMVYR